MQSYKRKITYFYEHHKDNVGTTAGFLMLEIRGDKVKIIINIQEPAGLPYQGAGLYFYHEAGDHLSAVKVGEVERVNGMLTYHDRTDWQNVYGTGRDLYTFDGVAVVYNESHYYIGDFMDKGRADYPLVIKKETTAAEKELSGDAEYREKGMPSKVTTNQVYRPGTRVSQAEKTEDAFSEVFKQKKTDGENSDVFKQEKTSEGISGVIRQKQTDDGTSDVFRQRQTDDGISDVFKQRQINDTLSGVTQQRKEVDEASAFVGQQKVEDSEAARKETVQQTSENWYENIPSPDGDVQLMKQMDTMNKQERQTFTPQEENQPSENTAFRKDNAVYSRCENCPYHKKRMEQQESANALEKMLAEYPKLPMYGAAELFDCVRIHPRDIGKLDMRNWKLGVNSFLTHGFYTYQYLLLGKMRLDGGKECPIIGVPGVFSNRDKYLANMFGFEQFVPIKKTGTKTGEFGYWIIEIQ